MADGGSALMGGEEMRSQDDFRRCASKHASPTVPRASLKTGALRTPRYEEREEKGRVSMAHEGLI